MSSLKEDLETLDPAEEVQKAFDESVVDGWTDARQSVAMWMGVDILRGVFGPQVVQLQDHGVYDNALHDVVIVAWLRSLSWEDVLKVRVHSTREQAVIQAYKWAQADGLSYASRKYLDGLKMVTRIVGQIYTCFSAAINNSSDAPALKKSTDQPGKSVSDITPHSPAEKALATS